MRYHERSTIGRNLFVASVLALAVFPVLPLLINAGGDVTARPVFTYSFGIAVRNSMVIGIGVGLVSFAVGFPLGLLSRLYCFPGQTVFVWLQTVPVLLPSFLLAIGWSNLATSVGLAGMLRSSGLASSILLLGCQAIPLPLLATRAACHNLTASQLDAARLHGGDWTVIWLSAKACGTAGAFAAMLGGVLSLSDPGAPLILGVRVAAVEILTSFASLYDYSLAVRQCLALAGLVLLCIAPLLWFGLPSLAAATLALQTRTGTPCVHRGFGRLAAGGALAVLLIGLIGPVVGLCLPVVSNPMIPRALQTVGRTWTETILYAFGAGIVAVTCATSLAIAVGRSMRWRMCVLGVMLGLFALPPALAGLGAAQLAAKAPPGLDWLTRGAAAPCVVLGLRFLPVATIAVLRAVLAMSPSWRDAARLHGVADISFFIRVVMPALRPALLVAFVLVSVLASADITTQLLLQPAGRQSLPVAIFTVMANSPEGLVASLSLAYLGCMILLLGIGTLTPLWLGRRTA
jgi:iron(III) transport system permease protein